MGRPEEPSAQSNELIGIEDEGESYKPIVHRATTLYRMLQQQVTKRRLSRKNLSGWQKVQIGSTLVLALSVLGILVFVLLITEEPAAAAAATAQLRY